MNNSHREVTILIKAAEKLLPGEPAPEETLDPRWQAIVAIGEYIEEEPEAIWQFICRWAEAPDEDLRTALASCLLEHLLEFHFDDYFPQIKERCFASRSFASTFCLCGKFGQSTIPENSSAFSELRESFI